MPQPDFATRSDDIADALFANADAEKKIRQAFAYRDSLATGDLEAGKTTPDWATMGVRDIADAIATFSYGQDTDEAIRSAIANARNA